MSEVASSAIRQTVPVSERASQWVFTITLALVLLALGFPEMPVQILLGILWTSLGLMVLLAPPRVRIPRTWLLLAAGFTFFSSLGFLPSNFARVSEWRRELQALGLDTGSLIFIQPRVAFENLVGFSITTVACLYLLGHRVNSRVRQRFALAFSAGVAVIASAAMATHVQGGLFGFFPNRNHTATLLAMGAFTGLGIFAQAVHSRSPWSILVAGVASAVCIFAILFYSESRAGAVLLGFGLLVWILLTGRRLFAGASGKALLLVALAAVGAFLIVESKVKSRLVDTVDRLNPRASATPQTPPATKASRIAPRQPIDGRLPVFQDTLTMIRTEPWTGVGPGQFLHVFQYYRDQTNAPNDLINEHPDSDWLWMASECGIPATLCAAAGLIAVFIASLRSMRKSRARLLGSGIIVAALIVPIHGLFDVPGHRVGIAWAAAFLLGVTLRVDSSGVRRMTLPLRFIWQGIGMLVLGCGLWLLAAEISGRPALATVKAQRLLREVEARYLQDEGIYFAANQAELKSNHLTDVDSLATSLRRVDEAIRLTPMEPHLHFVRGILCLHHQHLYPEADWAFAIQRKLVPSRVAFPLAQASAWADKDPERTRILWKEALRRAESEDKRFPGSNRGRRETFQRILKLAATRPPLAEAAFFLIGEDRELLLVWVGSAPKSVLDERLPDKLAAIEDHELQRAIFKIWDQRGSKSLVAEFAKRYPEISRP